MKICNHCGIELSPSSRNSLFCSTECRDASRKQKYQDAYYKDPKLCKKCNTMIPYEKHDNNFCNSVCSGSFNTKGRVLTERHKLSISEGLSTSTKQYEHVIYKKHLNQSKLVLWICPICKKEMKLTIHDSKNRTYCSKECFTYDQLNGKLYYIPNNPGPENKGGNVHYKGYYKSIWCDSTYELVWIVYNIDHNIQFQRGNESFPYVATDGNIHQYYPDFKLSDTEYVEIKNYLKPNDECKIKQFPHILHVLFLKDLKIHFDYVYSTYGKDLVSLYDKKVEVAGFEPTTF